MKEELNPYLILQKLHSQFIKRTGGDWVEIRKDDKCEGFWYLYFIEAVLLECGDEDDCEMGIKYRIPDDTGEPGTEIPCFERFHFYDLNGEIDIADFYRQYKNNVVYFNERYSSRYKLPLMSLNSFKKMYPELTKSRISQSNLLLLV